jgi:[acyl-carrier-protein] S-malonyltransferase
MGRDLASTSNAAKRTFEEADETLGFALSRLCFEGPEADLTATANAQPAILTHSIAVHRALGGAIGSVGIAAGHSLGEFTAYVAAGSMDFADGLRTVRRRGELMLRSGEDRPGTMAALIGLEDDAAAAVCREASGDGADCVPANFNAPGQIVISGDVPAVERAIELAKQAGARRALRLNVSGAFHSPLMRVAEVGLAAQLDAVEIRDPAFPVVSNVTASPVREGGEARRLLIEQLTSPVRWTATMTTIVDAGHTDWLELGPGSVLVGLAKRGAPGARVRSIGKGADVETFLAGAEAEA